MPRFYFAFMLWIILSISGCSKNKMPKISASREPIVRVLLVSASASVCTLQVDGVYKITNMDKKVLNYQKSLPKISVKSYQGNIVIGRHNFGTQPLQLKSQIDGRIIINGIRYRGYILFLPGYRKLQVINVVAMSKYLAGVLGSEMPLSWPIESLKAQAVIARSYCLYEKVYTKRKNFDVYDNSSSQVYRGMRNETEKARQIISKTRGMVLLYQNALFKTFFHSTCGGHTASAHLLFNYPDITPLAGRPCPFCQTSPYFAWQYQFTSPEQYNLSTRLKLSKSLFGIAAGKRDSYGRLVTLKIYSTQKRYYSIPALKIRRLIGGRKIKSTLFNITSSEQGILFRGRGWGHGVGLCQYGARTMGEKGYFVKDILQFYYPASTLYRLWK